jgi:hypothetical protein
LTVCSSRCSSRGTGARLEQKWSVRSAPVVAPVGLRSRGHWSDWSTDGRTSEWSRLTTGAGQVQGHDVRPPAPLFCCVKTGSVMSGQSVPNSPARRCTGSSGRKIGARPIPGNFPATAPRRPKNCPDFFKKGLGRFPRCRPRRDAGAQGAAARSAAPGLVLGRGDLRDYAPGLPETTRQRLIRVWQVSRTIRHCNRPLAARFCGLLVWACGARAGQGRAGQGRAGQGRAGQGTRQARKASAKRKDRACGAAFGVCRGLWVYRPMA